MEIQVPLKGIVLTANVNIPDKAAGIVIFSHGSGSSRHSSRNQFVTGQLEKKGLATFLFDLLTEEEDETYENRFNIGLLTSRLSAVTQWVQNESDVKRLPIGYFGASTGAASALWSAAELGTLIKAVVSRGGRPDLALPVLSKVTAPTLFLVGDRDYGVIELNEKAYNAIGTIKKMMLIKGATHLFEEPGTLQQVADLASEWFYKYLKSDE